MKKINEVLNQPSPLVDYNLYSSDKVLCEFLKREDCDWAQAQFKSFGEKLGSREVISLGFQANENRPVLKTYDRFGHRIDEVDFHPAWHDLMGLSVSYGIHNSPWTHPRPGAHVARAALFYMGTQVEASHYCPITMTYGAFPILKKQSNIFSKWESKLQTTSYDRRFLPHEEKSGVIIGMAMTEKQGGSDLRANITQAVPSGTKTGPGAEYLLTGHKWFCSAPMSDAFLVLAQTPKGLSCFFLPRWTPDGKRNPFFIQRLKDKLGNRANASSEVEFDDTWAVMVGEEGRGVPTIIEMANYTRLDCVVSSSGLMRQAVAQATHHCSHRSAFGKKLVDQPLMQNVLADLCVESEAATLMALRLARAYDKQDDQDFEVPFRRIATAIGKYWITKRAVSHVYEALEVHGGNGYIEESIMPRLYRETPVNSIWEGAGNVMCLDVLRAMTKEPRSLEVYLSEIKKAAKTDKHFDKYIKDLETDLREAMKNNVAELLARQIVEKLAIALQASLLLQFGNKSVTDAFISSRISKNGGACYGTLPAGVDFLGIIKRHQPQI